MSMEEYAEVFGEKFDSKPVFKRTQRQNSALHPTLRLLGDRLNSAGLDCKKVLKPSVDIPWTLDLVKDQLFEKNKLKRCQNQTQIHALESSVMQFDRNYSFG